jgi:surface polysaccharide O-acyltransferase-like enzyme
MHTQKNNTLELFKLFASYMVVFIHVKFYGRTGYIISDLARFAVPFFFLISGYFSYQITSEKIKKRIKHVVLLFLFSFVLYTVFNVTMMLSRGDTAAIAAYFGRYGNLKTLLTLFVFNETVSSVHLWYLLAIIYVYIIFYLVTTLRFSEKVIFLISFLLLFLHILLGECLSAFGIALPYILVRNFALMGIPFFALGLFAKKHENKCHSIPNYVIVIAVIIGIVETILSRSFLGRNELYVGSLFILFTATVTFIKFSAKKYPSFLNTLASCSTYIYIYHIMLSNFIKEVYIWFDINMEASMLLMNIHPIIVCIVSTVLAYFTIQITNKSSIKREYRQTAE